MVSVIGKIGKMYRYNPLPPTNLKKQLLIQFLISITAFFCF